LVLWAFIALLIIRLSDDETEYTVPAAKIKELEAEAKSQGAVRMSDIAVPAQQQAAAKRRGFQNHVWLLGYT